MKKFYPFNHRLVTSISRVLLILSLVFLSASPVSAQGPSTALDYDGVDDFTTLPAGIVQNLTGDFTIEFWVYWEGTGGDPTNPVLQPLYQRVFDFGNDDQEWLFFTPTTDFGTFGATFAMSNTGLTTPYVLQSPSKLPLNAWSHVAITYNDATGIATMYVNGVAVDSENFGALGTLSPSDLGVTTNNWLGRSQFAADPYFSGIIDEFRISNSVRYTTDFTPVPNQFAVDANTIALYHFNEGVGQTSMDATGNFAAAIRGGSVAVEGTDPAWVTNSILPVTFTHFGAEKNGNTIELKWRAFITGEGGKFIVQRSKNGRDFSSIGAVSFTAASQATNFGFTDQQPLSGKNYYRIQVEEAFAPVKYSSVIWVDLNDKSEYGIYPGAATSEVFIKIPAKSDIFIYNNAGMLVKRVLLQNSQTMNISDLPKGNYFVQIEGAETLRFVKL